MMCDIDMVSPYVGDRIQMKGFLEMRVIEKQVKGSNDKDIRKKMHEYRKEKEYKRKNWEVSAANLDELETKMYLPR